LERWSISELGAAPRSTPKPSLEGGLKLGAALIIGRLVVLTAPTLNSLNSTAFYTPTWKITRHNVSFFCARPLSEKKPLKFVQANFRTQRAPFFIRNYAFFGKRIFVFARTGLRSGKVSKGHRGVSTKFNWVALYFVPKITNSLFSRFIFTKRLRKLKNRVIITFTGVHIPSNYQYKNLCKF